MPTTKAKAKAKAKKPRLPKNHPLRVGQAMFDAEVEVITKSLREIRDSHNRLVKFVDVVQDAISDVEELGYMMDEFGHTLKDVERLLEESRGHFTL